MIYLIQIKKSPFPYFIKINLMIKFFLNNVKFHKNIQPNRITRLADERKLKKLRERKVMLITSS